MSTRERGIPASAVTPRSRQEPIVPQERGLPSKGADYHRWKLQREAGRPRGPHRTIEAYLRPFRRKFERFLGSRWPTPTPGASTLAPRLELFISERLRRIELRRPTCGQIRGSQRDSDQNG